MYSARAGYLGIFTIQLVCKPIRVWILSRQSDTPKSGRRGRGMSVSLRPASGLHSQTLLTTTTTKKKRCIYLGAEAGKEEYREHSLPWPSLDSERNECLELHPR